MSCRPQFDVARATCDLISTVLWRSRSARPLLTALFFGTGACPAADVAQARRCASSAAPRASCAAAAARDCASCSSRRRWRCPVILLVSAGLLVRSFIYLQRVDVGFDYPQFVRGAAVPAARSISGANEPRPLGGPAPGARPLFSSRRRGRAGIHRAAKRRIWLRHTSRSAERRSARPTLRGAYAFNHVRPSISQRSAFACSRGERFTADELSRGTAAIINRAAASLLAQWRRAGRGAKEGTVLGNRSRYRRQRRCRRIDAGPRRAAFLLAVSGPASRPRLVQRRPCLLIVRAAADLPTRSPRCAPRPESWTPRSRYRT